MDRKPGKDRKDALRQGREDLDTTIPDSADHTHEEQVRGQRHDQQPPQPAEKRKPGNG